MAHKTILRTCLALGILVTACAVPSLAGANNVTGPIQAFTDTSITVRGVTFTLTEATKYKGGTKADLAVDVEVRVRGKSEGGDLIAAEVKFIKEKNKNKITAMGEITEKTATTITVGGTVFTVTEATKIKGGTVDDLAVGVEVVVTGRKKADGSILAKMIKIVKEKKQKRKKITGVITEVVKDAAENVTRITLDDETILDLPGIMVLHGRHGLAATTNSLVEGMTVRVVYDPYPDDNGPDADGEATKFLVRGRKNIKGTIEAIAAPDVDLFNIVVNSNTIYYDDFTVVIGANQGVEDPGDLPAGTPVKVLCNPLDDGTFLANKVIVVGAEGQKGGVIGDQGVVSGVTKDGLGNVLSFDIDTVTYLVDGDTEFKVMGYEGPFPAEDFEDGLHVVVKAHKNADGDVVAIVVKVILPIFKYCGEITAVGADTFDMLGLTFNVTAWTEFSGFTTAPADISDLAVGDQVKVKAIVWPDDTLIASEIEPCDEDEDRVSGVIESATPTADGVELVVGGVTVNVTGDTKITKKSTMLTPADLIAGMTINAIGTFDASDILQADRIQVQ